MQLSIIIPSYNRAESLSRAVCSVYAQIFPPQLTDWELIVVDDGSDDCTQALLADDFPRVKVIRQTNRGVSAARNRGIRAAKGAWIGLLDSDDEWLPHKLATQFAALEHSGRLVCHTEEIWIRNGVRVNQMRKHQKSGGDIFTQCLPLCAMSPSSILLHSTVLSDVGLFDEDLPACEDYDLWLRVTARYSVEYVDQPCINKYGGHADQLSRKHWGMDRFRVVALEKILQADLNEAQRRSALQTLLRKLHILEQGARKHGNNSLIAKCEESMQRWQAST